MATAIICLALIMAGVLALRSYRKRLTTGCCGGSGEAAVKKIKVSDKDLTHYPHRRVLKVDGMSCGNCAIRVENALNSLEGVYARVNLMEAEADVRMKQELSDTVLKETVKDAGYTVYRITPVNDSISQ